MFSYSLLGLTQMIFAMSAVMLFGILICLVVYARLTKTERDLIDDATTEEELGTK